MKDMTPFAKFVYLSLFISGALSALSGATMIAVGYVDAGQLLLLSSLIASVGLAVSALTEKRDTDRD